MITLYEHQQELIQNLRGELRKHRSVLVQLATGGGKTVIAAHMMQGAAAKGNRCYFICHRQELVHQTSMTLDEMRIPHGIISASWPQNPTALIQIASIDTLKNRLGRVPDPQLCIWDECHHIAAGGWMRVKNHYASAFHIGLSATPVRLDGKGLDFAFDSMVKGRDTAWLIENGYLSTYRAFSPSVPNMDGIKTIRGDYDQQALEALMENKALIGDIVTHWQQHAPHKRTIAFAVSINHSQMMAATFRNAGIRAAHIDGSTPKTDRQNLCRNFALGKIDVLWNVNLFSEGFDLSKQAGTDATIEAVILARPTKSLAMYRQQVGRALRRKDYPAIILDHAGNILLHGLPDTHVDWTLAGAPKRGKRDAERKTPVNRCDRCFHTHTPAPRCPACGHVYQVEGRQLENYDGQLEEIDKETARKIAKQEQGKARTLDDLIKLGITRGYKNPVKWATAVYNHRSKKYAQRA